MKPRRIGIGVALDRMRPWAETVAIGSLLALAALPFVGLFPEPPAFGRGAAGIVAAVAILAVVGTAYRSAQPVRSRILRRVAVLLAITAVAIAARILLAGNITAKVPTPDILPAVFGLQGEDVDDAVLYEVWVELWLACALATVAAIGVTRALTRHHPPQPPAPPSPWDVMVSQPGAAAPWNPATVLLWLVGWAALAGTILDGHWTAAFLGQAVHVTGTIVDPRAHPSIRFRTAEGTDVVFTQNGAISRDLGAAVPVAYLTADPAGSARADTFWSNWGVVLGLLWIGLCFTLSPFFGFRAALRAGRW